jgi:hypothetical protein
MTRVVRLKRNTVIHRAHGFDRECTCDDSFDLHIVMTSGISYAQYMLRVFPAFFDYLTSPFFPPRSHITLSRPKTELDLIPLILC